MDRVEFDRVSKRYALGEHQNAREALSTAARRIVRLERHEKPVLWSLRDVSFCARMERAGSHSRTRSIR